MNEPARRRRRSRGIPWRVGALALIAAVWVPSAEAIVCTVPGSHPILQTAVDDLECTEVELDPGVYQETLRLPRRLLISGPAGGGTVIRGRVTVTGADTVVHLVDLAIDNGCAPAALTSLLGARVEGLGLEVVRQTGQPCPDAIFADSFESGSTSAWDATVP